MVLQECGLNLNSASKELQPHGSPEFPCAGYASHHTEREEDTIPWHWHEEIEVICITQGQMKLKIPSSSFLLEKGDLLIINSNIMHYGAAIEACDLRSFVFSPLLVTGSTDSVFSKKYIQPLLSCSAFTAYQITPKSDEKPLKWFQTAFDALKNDSRGFEFSVRENLSRMLLFCCGKFETYIEAKTSSLNMEELRIRKMLDYIHTHFSDNISLCEISAAAGISERECLRCFRKTIQLSPIQYLLKYRIMQGANMLLDTPAGSISETAISCGFDSPSNFTKTFRRFYGCSPREYRAKHRELA